MRIHYLFREFTIIFNQIVCSLLHIEPWSNVKNVITSLSQWLICNESLIMSHNIQLFHSFKKIFNESLKTIWPQFFHLQHGVKNSFWDQSARFDSFWHVLPKFDLWWLFTARCVPNSTIWPKFDLWRLLKVIIFDQKIVEVANTLISGFQNV